MPIQIDNGEKSEPIWESGDQLPDALMWLDKLIPLIMVTELSLCMTGKAYWHIERNRMRPLGVRWLLPSSIKERRTDNGDLIGFTRSVKGARIPLELDEVAYFWLPDWSVENAPPKVYPAKAAMRAAGVLNNLDTFLEQYFERGMVRATLLTSDGVMTTADRERLKAWWQRVATGIKNAFATEVVQASAVTPVVIGEGVGDLGNGELSREKREDIATAFGVPHSLMMSNAANYATSQQDEINFYTGTIIPQARNVISPAINRILGIYAKGLRLRFMPEKIEAFQASELQKAESVQRVVGGAVLTVNEGRALLGYDPVEGGDEIAIASAEPAPMPMLPEPTIEIDAESKALAATKFKRWYAKNLGRDVATFDNPYLSHAEKIVAADAVLRKEVEAYP
jgi:HK97 family phage portal protein